MSARLSLAPEIRGIAGAPRTLVRKLPGSREDRAPGTAAASARSVGRQADGTYLIIILTIFIFMSSKGGLRTGSSNQVPLRSVDL